MHNCNHINKIICGNCIEVLKDFNSESVDLVFADPPYNLQLSGELYRPNQTKVDAVNDNWDKFDSFDAYDKFTSQWLKECKRVLKPDGTIWVIGSYHNIFRVGRIMQDLGYWILNDIIWVKTNPMPNFKGTRFNNAHETLIWASTKQKTKYEFHYKSMKAFNDDKQMRSDWYIPICNGAERIKHNGEKAHSTQKPAQLLYRVIMSTSNPGDVVLDPFMGSGTTGAVAKRLGRNFIGIEKEPLYVDIANKRIEKVKTVKPELLMYPTERVNPRVPFGVLVANGYVKIGEKLYSKNKKLTATVMADSTIKSDKIAGSIHYVSAKLLGKESNNGWIFWYVERKGQLQSVDSFRNAYLNKSNKEKG